MKLKNKVLSSDYRAFKDDNGLWRIQYVQREDIGPVEVTFGSYVGYPEDNDGVVEIIEKNVDSENFSKDNDGLFWHTEKDVVYALHVIQKSLNGQHQIEYWLSY
jgi:hypothetical protein